MIQVGSRRDYHFHLQTGRNARRLLIWDGRQWAEELVGLALTVSYYSADRTSSLQVHYLSYPWLAVLCRLDR